MLIFIWCQTVCSIPMLPQWHIKDPSHSAKSAGGKLQLNVLTPLIEWNQSGLTMPSWNNLGTYQGNELTCNSSGNVHPQLSQFTEALWTDPAQGVELVCLSCCPLKKHRWGMIWWTFPQISNLKKKPPLCFAHWNFQCLVRSTTKVPNRFYWHGYALKAVNMQLPMLAC